MTVRMKPYASLTVQTRPEDARVILKGIKETYSPGVQLKAGTYKVLVTAENHMPVEREVILKPGQVESLSLDLVPLPRLYVTTSPANALVRVKGTKGFYAPGMRLKPGRYKVIATAETYKPASGFVTLNETGKTEAHLTLEKNTDDCLFPMNGISLGVSTVGDLRAAGVQCKNIDDDTGKPYLYYTVDGIDFWYDKDSGIVDYLPFSKGDKLHDSLVAMGFDQKKSYNDWLKVLKKNGFEVTVDKKPTIGSYKGKKWFKAELKGLKTTACGTELKIKLDFSWGDGRRASDRNTLNGIYIWGKKV